MRYDEVMTILEDNLRMMERKSVELLWSDYDERCRQGLRLVKQAIYDSKYKNLPFLSENICLPSVPVAELKPTPYLWFVSPRFALVKGIRFDGMVEGCRHIIESFCLELTSNNPLAGVDGNKLQSFSFISTKGHRTVNEGDWIFETYPGQKHYKMTHEEFRKLFTQVPLPQFELR